MSSRLFKFSSVWVVTLLAIGASFTGLTTIVAVATFVRAVLSSVASKVKVSVPFQS